MLTCWDQVEETFWFTTCFNFKKGAESPEPSSEFQRLKSQFFIQFSLRCSFYCTSYSKDSIVLYMFNFGLKKETKILVETNFRSFIFCFYFTIQKCCFWLYSLPLNYSPICFQLTTAIFSTTENH